MPKKAVRNTRTPKSDAVKGDIEPEVMKPPPSEAPSTVLQAEAVECCPECRSFDLHPASQYCSSCYNEKISELTIKADPTAVSLFENAPQLPTRDELRPDQDLLEAEKAEFKKLLDQKMPLNVRAEKLVKLAGMTGNKTAPVALRAIQVINEITGVSEDLGEDAPAMFNLPEGVKVSVNVEVPEK
jgi:hypothetical protein